MMICTSCLQVRFRQTCGVVDGQESGYSFPDFKTQYDYIIVGYASCLVTDTLLIAKYADSIIYVARANFLEKQMLYIPTTCIKSKNYQTCVCFQ
jgi:hypothetical protein